MVKSKKFGHLHLVHHFTILLRLRILGNKKTQGKSQNWVETGPSA